MKKTMMFMGLVGLLAIASTSFAIQTTLSWDPSPSSVAGYKIYYKMSNPGLPLDGTGAFEGNSPIDVGNVLTTTLSSLIASGVYYYAVTAYDSAGYESAYSNIVSSGPIIPDLDASWSSSDGVPLGTTNLVNKILSAPSNSYLKKYEGVVTSGEISCLELDAYFNNGVPKSETLVMTYAKDLDSGKIISSQSGFFPNKDYLGEQACVVYQENSINAEFFIDYGRDTGTYEFQNIVVTTSIPEQEPVKNFYLEKIVSPRDDVWHWDQVLANVDSIRYRITKTFKSALRKEGLVDVNGAVTNTVIADVVVPNTGQTSFTIPFTDIGDNGVFFTLSTIANGVESVPITKAHLPGNVIGTSDDDSPTLFPDVLVESIDTSTTYGYYRTRTYVPTPGGPASPIERASYTQYPYIIRYDYYDVRRRQGNSLLMKLL